jgi:protein-S-isoprenylcysteine O-methyltransferase Ste14
MRIRGAWLLVLPFLYFARPTPWKLVVGLAIALVGAVIRAWAAGTIHKGQTLAVRGPYAFTRNPLYVGSFLIGIGAAIAGGRWVFVAALLVFFFWIYGKTAVKEERELERRFGDSYRHYAASVPGFRPRLGRYQPRDAQPVAGQSFAFRRYWRNREYQAALGLLAGFGLLLLRMLL